jgi:transposase-like protein
MTLLEVAKMLNTNEKCLKFIEKKRWPNEVSCPRCNSTKVVRVYSRNKFECNDCKYQYNAIAGTVLSKTYIPLSKWMIAIYLFCSSKGKLKSSEIAKSLNLPYKTAWSLLKKIKDNYKSLEFEKLAGLIPLNPKMKGR